MTRVLIVSKTRMINKHCIGGLSLETYKSLRLLTKDNENQPLDSRYEIGQVWELDFKKSKATRAPHTEDVSVFNNRFIKVYPDSRLSKLIRENCTDLIWKSPTELFNGTLRFTNNGSGYVSENGNVPDLSTGYWLLGEDLVKCDDDGRIYYICQSKSYSLKKIRYVGVLEAEPTIPKGTLVRISLARWWSQERSDVEDRCYLQLSGWYELCP